MENFKSKKTSKNENWIAYRESKEFKSGLNSLENEPFLNSHKKIIILAVALDLKKAGEFDVNNDYIQLEEMQQMLSNLGIFYYRNNEARERIEKFLDSCTSNSPQYDSTHYLIGSTQESLDEAIVHAQPIPDSHELYGLAMEFPESAVISYSKWREGGEVRLIESGDSRLTDEENAFMFFRLSEDNWQEEIIWLEQIIAGVKLYSPAIYKQVMDSFLSSKNIKENNDK